MLPFDYELDYSQIDFRAEPHRYRVGKGEQGVLLVEPYKSELLPLWRFRTPAVAQRSADQLYEKFLAYLAAGDFPGADMARKFLQMGWTRARRYANHRGGRKYDPVTGAERPRDEDPEKAAAAAIFYRIYLQAREHPEYRRQLQQHRQRHESSASSHDKSKEKTHPISINRRKQTKKSDS